MTRSLLLSCESVSKAYGTRPLFEDLSFGLAEGDQVGLVGPNGSGKSTLLKILAGLESPDRGTRSLRGNRRVGYVPPEPLLPARGILWLESILAERVRAVLVVSHDRYFLEHVATRMLELSRVYSAGLFQTDGRYSDFLARRDDYLRGQAAYEESLANTVRREIAWLRRRAKARATKAN